MSLSRFRAPRCFVACAALIAVLCSPGTALSNEAVEAATQAAGINEAHCADLYSLNIEQSAETYPKVSEAWKRVSQVYDRTSEPYLLYWRGVLAQCLGQAELAVNDFQAFVQSQDGLGLFASLVRKAKTRLRRLGGQVKAGQGAAASWFRSPDVLEVRLSYRGGGGVRFLDCLDEVGEPGRIENTACLGSLYHKDVKAPGISPVGLELAFDLYPLSAASFLGLGARALVDIAVPTYEYCGKPVGGSEGGQQGGAGNSQGYTCTDQRSARPAQGVDFHGHAPGPVTQVYVGPVIRLKNSVASGGRGAEVRIEPRFAMGFGRFAPWAGSPKYHNTVGFLDAGSYAMRHFGGSLALSTAVELGSSTIVTLSGEVAVYAPVGVEGTPRVTDPQPVLQEWTLSGASDGAPVTVVEEVQVVPEVWQSRRMYASGRAGLLVPHEKANIAIGPFFQTAFHSAQVVYIDHETNSWNAGAFRYLRPYRYESLLGHPMLDTHFQVAQNVRPPGSNGTDPATGEDNVAIANPGNPQSEVQEEGFARKLHSTRRNDLYFLVGLEVRFGVRPRRK